VGLLDQLDEGEDIPRAFAAEAVPRLHLRVDLEARAVLLVEWAQAPEVLVPSGQANVLLDDLDQVDLGLDLGEGVIGRLLKGSPGSHGEASDFAGNRGTGTIVGRAGDGAPHVLALRRPENPQRPLTSLRGPGR